MLFRSHHGDALGVAYTTSPDEHFKDVKQVALTYKAILRQLWGPSVGMDNKILRVHVASIRRKIEPNPNEPRYIFTEVGVGYRLAESDDWPETRSDSGA